MDNRPNERANNTVPRTLAVGWPFWPSKTNGPEEGFLCRLQCKLCDADNVYWIEM